MENVSSNNTLDDVRMRSACEEVSARIRQGQTRVAETVLRENPWLAASPARAIELIYTEYVTLDSLGRKPIESEFLERFPKWKDQLERLLQIDEAVLQVGETARSAVDVPKIPGYRIVRPLGDGGMGSVYLAEQTSVRRYVALKILHPCAQATGDIIQRFHREAVMLGMLSHPHIAAVYASGVENGVHFLTMQYCQGQSLQILLSRRQRGEREYANCSGNDWYQFVLHTAVRVADAIGYAHDNGILHRDIKPANIIVHRVTGNVWVVDFGLAKIIQSDEATLTVGPLGTPGYSSPEQLVGGSATEQSDVYSLGMTIRRLLSAPCDSDRLPQWDAAVGEGLQRVVARAIHPEPELRYSSMLAFRDDLTAVLEGRPPRGARTSILRRAGILARRHRLLVSVSSLLMAVLLATALLYVRQVRTARRAEYPAHIESAVLKLHLESLLCLVDIDRNNQYIDNLFEAATAHAQSAPSPVDDSLRDLDAAAAIDAQRLESLYYRAQAFIALGRTSDAQKQLQLLLRREPRFVPALSTLALLMEYHTPADALVITRSKDRRTWLVWEQAWFDARLALQERRWNDAARQLTQVLESQQAEPFAGCFLEARLLRSSAYLQSGKYSAAIEDLAAVRARWPRALEPALLIGKAYLLAGDDARARLVFHYAHEHAAAPDVAALWTAVIYHTRSQTDETREWLTRIRDDRLRSLSLAYIAVREGEYQQAERIARTAIKKYTTDPALWTQLSGALWRLGRFAEAAEAAKTATRNDPCDYRAHGALGLALEQLGEHEKAMTAFAQSLRNCPNNARWTVAIGNSMLRMGRPREAIDTIQLALRHDPYLADAHFMLGAAYEAMERFDDAIAQYAQAAQIAPTHAFYHQRLAEAYARSQRWCQCLHELTTELNMNPQVGHSLTPLIRMLQNPTAYCCDADEGFHVSCGEGERMLHVLERVATSHRDARTLSALALAQCLIRPDRPVATLSTVWEVVEMPDGDLPTRTATFRQVIGHLAGERVGGSDTPLHLLELLPALPPLAAIDALLEVPPTGDQAEALRQRVMQRFSSETHSPETSHRLAYLMARLDQFAGRHDEAQQRLRLLLEQDASGRPEPVLRLVQSLRASDAPADLEHHLRTTLLKGARRTSERSLADSNASASNRQRRGVSATATGQETRFVRWDFDGSLEADGDGTALQIRAVLPATTPEVCFERATIAGRDAHVCRFSRGSYFELEHELGSEQHLPLSTYTVLLDVRMSLEAGQFASLWQTNPKNLDDADWACHPELGLGIVRYGGTLDDDKWHRLALVVDASQGTMVSYIDGRRVQVVSLRDASITHVLHLGSTALLFADDDEENAGGWINSAVVCNAALSPRQIAVLGGPTAEGIALW